MILIISFFKFNSTPSVTGNWLLDHLKNFLQDLTNAFLIFSTRGRFIFSTVTKRFRDLLHRHPPNNKLVHVSAEEAAAAARLLPHYAAHARCKSNSSSSSPPLSTLLVLGSSSSRERSSKSSVEESRLLTHLFCTALHWSL